MCIFCKIINKEIPSYPIYEDDKVIAILDISQVCKGHTLIIPKHHYPNFLSCDDATIAHMMKVAKSLGNHLLQTTGASGMNILSNVHEVAGQTIDHCHVHLIPRYSEKDAIQISFHPNKDDHDFASLMNKLTIQSLDIL